MTLDEFAALPGNSVGTKEAAEILGCDRYALNVAAKQGMLGLPHFFSGNRLKISKAAILAYCGRKEAGAETPGIFTTTPKEAPGDTIYRGMAPGMAIRLYSERTLKEKGFLRK